jgi:hypothetical protein
MHRRVVLIRHGDDPDDDRVVTYFRSRNIEPEIIWPFKRERLGDMVTMYSLFSFIPKLLEPASGIGRIPTGPFSENPARRHGRHRTCWPRPMMANNIPGSWAFSTGSFDVLLIVRRPSRRTMDR